MDWCLRRNFVLVGGDGQGWNGACRCLFSFLCLMFVPEPVQASVTSENSLIGTKPGSELLGRAAARTADILAATTGSPSLTRYLFRGSRNGKLDFPFIPPYGAASTRVCTIAFDSDGVAQGYHKHLPHIESAPFAGLQKSPFLKPIQQTHANCRMTRNKPVLDPRRCIFLD